MDLRATISVRANFLSILQEKTYFFYFTHLLLQYTYISLSILHIYSIKYSFLLHFLLFPSLSSLKPSHKPNTNPKSPTPSHRPLHWVTVFSIELQTQHKPKITHTQPPATIFSIKLQTQHKPKITHTQPLATINNQIEQNHPASYRLLDAKLKAQLQVLDTNRALGYPHLADHGSQRGSTQNKITHTQPRIAPVRLILCHPHRRS